METCWNCGTPLNDDHAVCAACGAAQPAGRHIELRPQATPLVRIIASIGLLLLTVCLLAGLWFLACR